MMGFSTPILMLSFFLSVSSAEMPQRLEISQIKPFYSNHLFYILNSVCSIGFIPSEANQANWILTGPGHTLMFLRG